MSTRRDVPRQPPASARKVNHNTPAVSSAAKRLTQRFSACGIPMA